MVELDNDYMPVDRIRRAVVIALTVVADDGLRLVTTSTATHR